MTIKLCSNCKQEKNTSEFRKDKTKKDGFQSQCKPCSRTRIQKLYAENYREKYGAKMTERRQEHAKRIRVIKQSLGCACCPERHISCIEFHHIDGSNKEFIVGPSAPRSWNQIVSEMIKCICVCANCHRKIHDGVIQSDKLQAITIEQINVAMAE